jgi:hypothetical protein
VVIVHCQGFVSNAVMVAEDMVLRMVGSVTPIGYVWGLAGVCSCLMADSFQFVLEHATELPLVP